MVFSSIEFIFLFLPVFLTVYYLLPKGGRKFWLFVGSIFFYALGSLKTPEHIGLFLMSVVLNYTFGRLIGKYDSRFWLFVGITCNVLYFAVFKYYLGILPIGISFYTFQAMSYLFDVKKHSCKEEKSFVNFGAYLSMFPQLIAGPIVQFPMIGRQLRKGTLSLSMFVSGLELFILGLGSKVLLANQIGKLWKQVLGIGFESISTPLAWMGIAAFSFQIYFDFWGYSLMAMGLGKMLGFELPKNFDHPYTSVSMTEFWRRWHMTLGAWFREYVYIPLGGNRCGQFRTYLNLLIVWVLTGVWHGAGWNFVLWGLTLFMLIALEKAGLKRLLDRYRIIGHAYMLLVIPLSWAIFANTNLDQLVLFFQRLFAMGNTATYLYAGDYLKYGEDYGLCMLLCLLFSTRLPQKVWKRVGGTYVGKVVLVGIFIGVIYCLYIGMDNPFLYYQF